MVGLDWTNAAQCAGISVRALQNWRNDEPEIDAELQAVKSQTVAVVAAELMKRIRMGDMQAIKFWLSTRAPEFREKRADVEVNVDARQVSIGPPAPEGQDMGDFIKQLADVAAKNGMMRETEEVDDE
jgi:hypothetical protein